MRLKEVMPNVIDKSQCVFVQGRELVHNVLICQELAHGYRRKSANPKM